MRIVRKTYAIITNTGKEVQLTFDINMETKESFLAELRISKPLNKKEVKAVWKIIDKIKESLRSS